MARRDLRIYVTADSRGAVRATGKMSSSLSTLAKSAALAGGALGAAGLAAGAKKAFDEFQQAEKATKQTNAVLKSTGGVAKVTSKHVSDLANAISLKAGIDDEAIQSGENLLLTFTKIRDEAGKGNKVFSQATQVITDMSVSLGQDLKSSAIQVGKALQDPEKGITALRRVGVNFTQTQSDMIKGWVAHGKQLKAQKFILKELNTEFGGSAAAQATATDKLKVAWDNLFESIGRAFAPLVEKAAGKLAKFINQMQTGRGAGGRFADKMKDLADAAKDVGQVIGPPLKAIGEFALKHPKVAAMAAAVGALAVGFGKLRAGPAGGGKLGSLGSLVGAMKPVPVFVTNPGFGGIGGKGPGGVPAPTGGKIPAWLRVAGPIGAGIAATEGLDAALGHPGPANTNRGLAVVGGKTPGGASWLQRQKKDHQEWTQSVKNAVDKNSAAYERGGQIQTKVMSKSSRTLADLRQHTAQEMGRIRNRFSNDSAAARDALAHNFERAALATQRTMDRAGRITRSGLDFVKQMFVQELRLYGLNPRQALASANVRTGEVAGGFRRQDFQSGGTVVPGFGSGDKVHMQAMVEPGEQVFVLNRNASSMLSALENLNGSIPRFQAGGGLKPGISRLVSSVLGKFPGLNVSSTTGGTHAPGSYHYRGLAADLASSNYTYMNQAAAWIRGRYGRSLTEGIHNPNLSVKNGQNVSPSFWGADTWAGHANHIHLALAGALKAMSRSIGRVNIRGRGPLRDMIQKGVNAARRGANRRLSGMSAPDTGFRGARGGYGKGQLANLWTRAGGNPSISNLMAAIALAESGGNPQAHNPSGASGLWQILGQIVPGNVFNPMVNARNAVAKYRSQGLGAWVAYTSGSYRKFLRRGGRLQGGGHPKRHHRRHRPVGVTDPFSFIPGAIRETANRDRRHRTRAERQTADRIRRMRQNQASNFPDAFMQAFSDKLAFDDAMAALTPDTADDMAVAQDAVRGWQAWLDLALARGDQAGATLAATNLAGARGHLQDLQGGSSTPQDLVQAIKDLKDSIDQQNAIAGSVAGIGQREALKAFADVISGHIAGYGNQRARSAGDGVTAARY